MIKKRISNFILSKIDIDKTKKIFGEVPFLKYFYKWGSQSLIDYTYPTHLYIETTRACNLACTCCPRELKPGQKGHMEMDIFKKIVDEATTYGIKNFCLHMLGEPLLHPKITEMVQYIKDSNAHHAILLTTNGSFLDEKKIKSFFESGLDKITISMFTLVGEKSVKLVGKNDIERVIQNLKKAVEIKKEKKATTRLTVRVIVSDDNKEEIKAFRTLTSDLGIHLELRFTHNYSGVIQDNFMDKHAVERLRHRYPCYHLFYSPSVTWDGKIVMCCTDWNYSEILGDVRETTVAKAWQDKRMKELRDHHFSGEYDKIPLCAKCNVWSTYPDIFFEHQKNKTKGIQKSLETRSL